MEVPEFRTQNPGKPALSHTHATPSRQEGTTKKDFCIL